MSWTQSDDVRAQLVRAWEGGKILGAHLRGEPMFPLRLRTSRPSPADLSQRFDEVRRWIRELEAGSKSARGSGYEIQWGEVSNRQLGRNRIPEGIVIPSEHDALAFIGKRREAELALRLAGATVAAFPQLESWVAEHPMRVLENADCWERVLAVLGWFRDHPRPGVYLRQLDAPGVDSKFVEGRRALISELLDLVLPDHAVDAAASGAGAFERRYGLRAKPALIRFRVLDDRHRVGGLSDVATPDSELARMQLDVQRVFITENEINGLAFPDVSSSIVIFGLGYRVDRLAQIEWLKDRELVYWGDLDTHGFAILDRLRRSFGEVRSLLMDKETLLAHKGLWGREEDRHDGPLPHLTAAERDLYDELRLDRLGERVRLEQERIGFGWVEKALRSF